MNDQKKFVVQFKDDTLTEAAQRADFLFFRLADGRIERSQNERAADADFLDRLIEDALRERLDVNGDVGILGHGRRSKTANGG